MWPALAVPTCSSLMHSLITAFWILSTAFYWSSPCKGHWHSLLLKPVITFQSLSYSLPAALNSADHFGFMKFFPCLLWHPLTLWFLFPSFLHELLFHYSFLKCQWSEVAQSCPTLCDLMDSSLPGSSIHGIFQARILEWVAISFSRGSSWPRDRTWVSCTSGRLYHMSHLGRPKCQCFILTPLFFLFHCQRFFIQTS